MITPCNAENGCGMLMHTGGSINAPSAFAPAAGISRSQMTDVTNSRSAEAVQIQNTAQTARSGAVQVQNSPETVQNTPGRQTANTVQTNGAAAVPSQTGVIASTFPMPGSVPQTDDFPETIAGQPDPPFLQMPENPASGAQNPAPVIPESNPGSAAGIVPPPILPEAPQFAVPLNPLMPPGYQEFISYENLQYLNGFLRTQIGKYMRVEQQVGSNSIEERYGYLIGVGINYILLQELGTGNVSTLDYYNIKFVYIYYTNPSLPQGPQK